jgi:hypothetical protein
MNLSRINFVALHTPTQKKIVMDAENLYLIRRSALARANHEMNL